MASFWYNSVVMRLGAFLFLTAIGLFEANAGTLVTSTAELRDVVFRRPTGGVDFHLLVTNVIDTAQGNRGLTVVDNTGGMILSTVKDLTEPIAAGEVLEISGLTRCKNSDQAVAAVTSFKRIGIAEPPKPVQIEADEFLSGKYDCRAVQMAGTVREIIQDEIDPAWLVLVLCSRGTMLQAFLPSQRASKSSLPAIGSHVRVNGVCIPRIFSWRDNLGSTLAVMDLSSVSSVDDPAADPFFVPNIRQLLHRRSADIATLDRHGALGTVIARSGPDKFLLRTSDGAIANVELLEPNLPPQDEQVEVVGFPYSDMYRINLSKSVWRSVQGRPIARDAPEDVSFRNLLTDLDGQRKVKANYHGKVIRFVGLAKEIGPAPNGPGTLLVETDSCLVRVNASACTQLLSEIREDCRIEITGVCVIDTESWRPDMTLPKIKGIEVIPRDAADLRIVASPPWFTPMRLFAIIGVLTLVLLAILTWNLILNRIVERRSRELLKAQATRLGAELRIDERTRLAVELHDSVAQNLTGVSLQIDAAKRFADSDRNAMLGHLGIASRSLLSCRAELKNCLWDLRSQALDEHDLDKAILLTVKPHIGTARLTVRFNVPRQKLSDSTTHALLRIVRELASNAVRHGHATAIQIAGCLDEGSLRFSVTDNGCGFAPASAPGMAQGHYGLQGIRERVRQLGGSFSISSEPGKGARMTVSLGPSADPGQKEQT